MLIFRYISKEIIATLTAVTAILVVILLCNQFIRYISAAAVGKFAAGMILQLMLLQVPHLLSLLLPLGLFLGILLVFGRLYADSEMTVLAACGVSKLKLLQMLMILASALAIIVAILSFWIIPRIANYSNQLLVEARSAPMVEKMLPGRFLASNEGRRVYYVEKMSRDHQQLRNIFVAEQPVDNKVDVWTIVSAATGYQTVEPKSGEHYMVIVNGYDYQGEAGSKEYKVVRFNKAFLQIASQAVSTSTDQDAKTTWDLVLAMKNPRDMAELQWRISLPLSVLLLGFLALPLSYVKPRQGRYIQLLPAILIYIFYANMMFVSRDWLEEGKISPMLGLWWLHASLFGVGILIWTWHMGWMKLWFYRWFKKRAI
ncbi:LPS export ABC transporter permease LptF [soil metagenome]